MELVYHVKLDRRHGEYPFTGTLWTREELDKKLAGSAFAKAMGQDYQHKTSKRDIQIFVNGIDHGLYMAWLVNPVGDSFPMPKIEYSVEAEAVAVE